MAYKFEAESLDDLAAQFDRYAEAQRDYANRAETQKNGIRHAACAITWATAAEMVRNTKMVEPKA